MRKEEKTKQRVKLAKSRMDALKPQIEAARDKYMELMVLYEDECQLLRSYARRGVISQEEVVPYLFRKNKDNHRTSLNTLLKEYRAKKTAETELELRTGYCPICDKDVEVRSDDSMCHCPECGHHIVLHREEVAE